MGKWSPCSLQEINRDKIRGSFSPFMNSAGYLVEQQIKRDDIDVHVQRKKKEKKKSIIAHIFFDINSVQETELPPTFSARLLHFFEPSSSSWQWK
jgi:hypothetical protein